MTKLTYTEAVRYLCLDPALHADDEDRRDEARAVITDAVWHLAKEGDKNELWDWIAEGDWSPADLGRLAAYSADALAAEWDEQVREADRVRAAEQERIAALADD